MPNNITIDRVALAYFHGDPCFLQIITSQDAHGIVIPPDYKDRDLDTFLAAIHYALATITEADTLTYTIQSFIDLKAAYDQLTESNP